LTGHLIGGASVTLQALSEECIIRLSAASLPYVLGFGGPHRHYFDIEPIYPFGQICVHSLYLCIIDVQKLSDVSSSMSDTS
jgi:hypothetical protein